MVRDDSDLMSAVTRTVDAGAELPLADRLLVLEIAWMSLAGMARSEALAFPGEFPAEQGRQLDHLEKIATLVRNDTPDIELERLFQEKDYEGVRRRFRKLMDDLGKEGD